MARNTAGTGDNRSGEETRRALIEAGLKLFGAKGYEATSTREIAAGAGANIASIAYHFGGKEGLRLACAEMVADRLKSVIGSVVLEAEPAGDAEQAVLTIERGLSAFLQFLLGQSQARDISAFIIGEVRQPGPVLDRLYEDVFLPVHGRLCQLLAVATDREAEDDAIRLGAFTLAGQTIYFRLAQAIVTRRMGWETVGQEEIDAIRRAVLANIRAFVAANRPENRR